MIELDVMPGGSDLQLGLQEVTGRSTVPQVFVGGKHVGGCDGEYELGNQAVDVVFLGTHLLMQQLVCCSVVCDIACPKQLQQGASVGPRQQEVVM